MAKPSFRLATLLRLRESVRDERRGELAEAFRADELLQQRAAELEQSLEQIRRQCREQSLEGAVDIDRLLDGERYELLLQAERQLLGQHRGALEAEIEKRRQALVAADADVRVLEKLRAIQAERKLADETRRELREIDEAAGRMTLRKESP